MEANKVLVTTDEMEKLKSLAQVIQNKRLPLSRRRLAKSEYESILKYAKHCQRPLA